MHISNVHFSNETPCSTYLLLLYTLGKIKPFRVGVHFDGFEVCTAAATNTCEYDAVAAIDTGGITGFQLTYWQNTC